MEQLKEWLSKFWGEDAAHFAAPMLIFVGVLVLGYIANFVARRILLRLIEHFAKRSKTLWDDILVKRKVFSRLSHLAPALVIYVMAAVVFKGYPGIASSVQLGAKMYMAIVGLLVADALLNSVVDIYQTFEFSRRMPIRGFVQIVKIVLYVSVAIVVLSMILGKSPAILFGSLGAMTAVVMLIFKDSILGFVAGIQLSTNRMLHIGDWIEMPKYNADGDVIDISLMTVKVRNWDKTIATIPTYALISDSFRNWRGMAESGGRRIKRSIYIDMTSITFCTEQMLAKFRKFRYISDYIDTKMKEISEHNAATEVDESELVNGRHLTNIGTFRAYVAAYLRNHPKIHQDMTFLIRHLEPTAHGLPIQIYVFSNDQIWANYEAIQADIFDHLLAVVPEFGLRVFQNPTGADFQRL